MKKVIRLTESDLIRVIKRVIEETSAPSNNLLGRKFAINPDGTVSISNNQNKLQKIRLYTKLGDMNIKNISPNSNGYTITGGKMSKDVGSDVIKKVINFVDTGSPSVIESGSMLEPDLRLKKV
jgi:hypothetical protein